MSGRLVAKLAPGRFTWDGRDARGREVSSGVYFARVAGAADAAGSKFLLLH